MQLIILTFLPVRDAFCSAQNAPKPFSAPDPSREVYDAPRSPSWMGMAMPPPHKSPSSMLDLSVVAASKSVPNFHHRFMVTLLKFLGKYLLHNIFQILQNCCMLFASFLNLSFYTSLALHKEALVQPLFSHHFSSILDTQCTEYIHKGCVRKIDCFWIWRAIAVVAWFSDSPCTTLAKIRKHIYCGTATSFILTVETKKSYMLVPYATDAQVIFKHYFCAISNYSQFLHIFA